MKSKYVEIHINYILLIYYIRYQSCLFPQKKYRRKYLITFFIYNFVFSLINVASKISTC